MSRFPDDDMLGVDLVIPDTTYLKRNLNKAARLCHHARS